MAISEETRHQLFQRLEEVLGPEEATTLMEHLPPVGWADVATKRDIDALGVATKRDIDNLGVATNRDIEALRVATNRDIDALRVATKRDIDGLRVATKRDTDALGVATERAIHDVKREMRELAVSTQRDIADVKREIHDLAVSTQREIHEGAVAANRDTTDLGQALRLEMVALETRIGGRLERELRMMTWRLITAAIAFGSLLVAAIRL